VSARSPRPGQSMVLIHFKQMQNSFVWIIEGHVPMSAYTAMIFPCKPRPGQYKKSSPETLMPPSDSYSPLLS
jgi:hypothetical protein